MKTIRIFAMTALVLLPLLGQALAEDAPVRYVRIAELEIDPAQVDAYHSALKEEIEASIRLEPGVLSLLAVAVKDQPARVRIMEIYADVAAYRAHLETPHFKKYKTSTQSMVKSLNLLETDPILLGSKGK
jgi:quinol monooxygenase YgiN